jgi:L-glyceraldehyde 3-phosphate reductase
MLDRWVEDDGLLDVLGKRGVGSIAFSPLAQGLLTNKYLKDIPSNSRMANPNGFLQKDALTPKVQDRLNKLNELASDRGQSLAQMAIAWLLKDARITSVLIGSSSVDQLSNNLDALNNTGFTDEELNSIEKILK